MVVEIRVSAMEGAKRGVGRGRRANREVPGIHEFEVVVALLVVMTVVIHRNAAAEGWRPRFLSPRVKGMRERSKFLGASLVLSLES